MLYLLVAAVVGMVAIIHINHQLPEKFGGRGRYSLRCHAVRAVVGGGVAALQG